MKTSTNNKSDLKEVFALWETKKSDTVYYTGKTSDKSATRLVAFVNTTKKNPNQPDINVYEQKEKGEDKPQVASLWQNKSKASKLYYSGTDNEDKRIVGFINEDTQSGKYPSIRVYYSDKQ